MVTLEQLVRRAQDELGTELTSALALRDDVLQAVIGRIVKSAIDGLGFNVSDVTGEVCDPRPKAVVNYPYDAVERNQVRRGRFRR